MFRKPGDQLLKRLFGCIPREAGDLDRSLPASCAGFDGTDRRGFIRPATATAARSVRPRVRRAVACNRGGLRFGLRGQPIACMPTAALIGCPPQRKIAAWSAIATIGSAAPQFYSLCSLYIGYNPACI